MAVTAAHEPEQGQSPAPAALLIDMRDNVATALRPLTQGQTVIIGGLAEPLGCRQEIPFAHKIAVRALAQGEEVIKYGQPIGVATAAIGPGEHVHTHNVVSLAEAVQTGSTGGVRGET